MIARLTIAPTPPMTANSDILPNRSAVSWVDEVQALAQRRLGFARVAVGEVERHLGDAQVLAGEDLEQDLEPARLERRRRRSTRRSMRKNPVIGIGDVLEPDGEHRLA